MTLRPASIALLCLGMLTSNLAGAEPRGSKIDVHAASVPAGTDANVKRALAAAVTQHAAAAGLADSLRGYSLSPALVQLRRYAEPGRKHAKVVCIVSLALNDPHGSLVAEVRGNASASGGGLLEVVDAAAQAAVTRVPAALAKLRGENGAKVAQR